MSVESLAVALHHSKSRGTAKVVLLGIANHDGDAGSFPKVATLAKYANVHPRRVQQAIATLVELGEISVDTKQGGMRDMPDHLRPNLYRFTLACPADCDRSSAHRMPGEKVARSRKGTAGLVDNLPRTGDENSTGDENVSGTGDENVTSTGDENVSTKNHHLEPSLEPSRLASRSTSPESGKICWACGKPEAGKHATYCRSCEANGLNNPMISCYTEGCDAGVQRRTYPGQQHFDCGQHETAVARHG